MVVCYSPDVLLSDFAGVRWSVGRALNFVGRHIEKMKLVFEDRWNQIVRTMGADKLVKELASSQIGSAIGAIAQKPLKWATGFEYFEKELHREILKLTAAWNDVIPAMKDLDALEKGYAKRAKWTKWLVPVLAMIGASIAAAAAPVIPLAVVLVAIVYIIYSLRDRLDMLPDAWPFQIDGIPSIVNAHA